MPKQDEDRAKRLAAALRDNLKRRKEQSRGTRNPSKEGETKPD
jgi:hypothetical protein